MASGRASAAGPLTSPRGPTRTCPFAGPHGWHGRIDGRTAGQPWDVIGMDLPVELDYSPWRHF
ncbi:hypothetical protein F750_6532 [Streptomyces sp. PAMC 26508]|nr:hypothetical protein F750_6532 [Streptomyces sp. PAMC 26508]